jgi:hypothetical protein
MRSVDSIMAWNLFRPTMKNPECLTIRGNARKNNRNDVILVLLPHRTCGTLAIVIQ